MEANETLDWETFEQKVKDLRAKYRRESSPLLFRGQGNSDWPLTTTLERGGAGRMLFRDRLIGWTCIADLGNEPRRSI